MTGRSGTHNLLQWPMKMATSHGFPLSLSFSWLQQGYCFSSGARPQGAVLPTQLQHKWGNQSTTAGSTELHSTSTAPTSTQQPPGPVCFPLPRVLNGNVTRTITMVTFQQLRIELCGKWILKIPIKNEMTKKQFSAWSLVWEGLGVFLLLLFTAKKVWSVLFLRVPFLFVNGSTVSSGEVTFCAPIACRNPTLLKLCLPTFPTRITARLAAIWGHWVLQKCFWHRRINIGVFSYQAPRQQGKVWTHRTTKYLSSPHCFWADFKYKCRLGRVAIACWGQSEANSKYHFFPSQYSSKVILLLWGSIELYSFHHCHSNCSALPLK